MKNAEIQDMLSQVKNNPDSEFSKFILDNNNTADNLLDFLLWVDMQTLIVDNQRFLLDDYEHLAKPQTHDMLVTKYLNNEMSSL